MLCLSGFELYSRWVPLFKATCNCRHYFQSEMRYYNTTNKACTLKLFRP